MSIRISCAFDDSERIVSLVRQHGPYPSIASYLPPAATSGSASVQPESTAAWFRGNWAVAGRPLVDGASSILENARFAAAAAELFNVQTVIPTTVVVNVNAPMRAGAVHLDIPSFRGASRDEYPLRLLQAMGTSGLFEPWRIVEAGVVTWFYDGPGGNYDYWPQGLDGPMWSERPPYWNTSLAADNDRMYHRIGEVGEASEQSQMFPVSASITHRAGGEWEVFDGGHLLRAYPDGDVRISILWKAQVVMPDEEQPRSPLSLDRVTSILNEDMAAREVNVRISMFPPMTDAWIDLVHETYYPVVKVD